MTSSSYHWVTVARFWSSGPAVFLKSLLEANDIPAFVRNEYLGGLFAHLTLGKAEGGIELQVPSDLVEQAQQVLEGLEAHAQETEAPDEESEKGLS